LPEYLLRMSTSQRLAYVLLLACRDAMCEIEDVAAHLKGGKWAPSQESLLPILQFADWATKHTNYPSVSASRSKAAEQNPLLHAHPALLRAVGLLRCCLRYMTGTRSDLTHADSHEPAGE
jgi:hypothetical protein